MVSTARPCGVWRDWVLGPSRPRSALVRDTAAPMAFRVPLYAAIIWAGGADGTQVSRGACGATIIMLIAGRPQGMWLDAVRGAFGLPPGGMKPMSPGG